MQEVLIKNNELQVAQNECFLCFEGGVFFKCKAIGTKDFIFTGQFISVLNKYSMVAEELSFSKTEIFIFSEISTELDHFIQHAKDEQVIVVSNKNINIDHSVLVKNLQHKKFLIVYDISLEAISLFLEKKNIYCSLYLASKDHGLNLDFIYKKISFLQKIDALNLNNSNITQRTQEHLKSKWNPFRKKAIIIDLGVCIDRIKMLFEKKYDIYILSAYADLEIINDIDPDVVIFSDGFFNPNLTYKSLEVLINFCINSNIDIYGFGFGMFLVSISIGIKCKLIGFNYKDSYIFNYQNQIIKNSFLPYYCLENIESKKIINKIYSADKERLYGFVYKYHNKKIIGINDIENLKYLTKET